ncbi:hypothetical protein ZOSMA_402G00010 [Zostera marina]|uniref:non-specific serine/threonine protein kinase n=1 Tax=Zostera marina TaxID=29655 RepID=A0A0K9P3C3_ZOSMR|nr:hypothetical protein ZOSMA_402G00010 [Zostera marina]
MQICNYNNTFCFVFVISFPAEYANTMKVTEKSDIYSYGVVLLELVTGRKSVQQLEGSECDGDLVSWVRDCVRNNDLSYEILDSRVNLDNKNTARGKSTAKGK